MPLWLKRQHRRAPRGLRTPPLPLAGAGGWSVTTVGAALDEGHRYSRLRRRRIFLAAIVALVVVAAAGGVLLATQIKSPAQLAAETRPPPATVLTATVQRTVLTSTVLGQAVVGPPREVSLSDIGGGAAGPGVQPIVTRIFCRTGSRVRQGTVILEVAGRPFFVLQGTVPAYRNLAPGEKGEDVVQLQDDLEALGYGIGSDASGYPAEQMTAGPRAERGAYLPLGEYAFVPRLPARVVKLGATVGQRISGGVTLATGSPVTRGQLNPSDAGLVRPGMHVVISEPGTGKTISGRVTRVSHSTASTASISGGLYVAIRVRPSRPLPLSLVGQDLSLTIASARSAGPVLAVPEAAIFAAADGGTYVTALLAGRRVRVPVRVGMTGSGLVQVIPRRPGALRAGEQVVTGASYVAGNP